MTTYEDLIQTSMQVPLDTSTLSLLARRCGVHSGTRLLDLACYRGELLNTWARDYDLRGTGVDEREDCIGLAQTRANDLNVWSQVHYVTSDVYEYPQPFHEYNIISWLTVGAGYDLPRWLAVMQTALRDDSGLLVVGESYWSERPSASILAEMDIPEDALPTLADITLLAHQAQFSVVDMLILTPQDWDGYYAQQWRAVAKWLVEHPEDDAAASIREKWRAQQTHYLSFERQAVGYGVFVLASV